MADITKEDERRILRALQDGTQAPDGGIIPCFSPEAMADLIEKEVLKAKLIRNPKLTIHMDLEDALILAKFLRYRSL